MTRSGQITEYAKVFINIASLLLGLSVTFLSRIAVPDATNITVVVVAWALCILSIYLGASAIRKLVTTVSDESASEEDDDSGVDLDKLPVSPAISTSLNRQVATCLASFVLIAFVAMRSSVMLAQQETNGEIVQKIAMPSLVEAKVTRYP